MEGLGRDSARTHYSPLNQITAANVSRLKPVWVWDGGNFGRSWEITPLLIDGLLYISETQSGDIIALEPETGKEVWRRKSPVTCRQEHRPARAGLLGAAMAR